MKRIDSPPSAHHQPSLWGRFNSFQYRDYRLMWVSSTILSASTFMEQVVLSWMILELTDSAFMVGVASGARMAPFLLLGLLAGAIADRVSRRVILPILVFGLAAASLIVAGLLYLDLLQVWHVLVIAFFMGALRAFYMATRSSFIYDIVGPRNALTGISMVSIGMRTGGLIGTAGGGFLIVAWGVGAAYLAMGLIYSLAALALLLVRDPGQSAPSYQGTVAGNLKGAVRALRENRSLAMLTGMVASGEALGFSHMVVLPILARDVLQVGAGGFGVLMAFRSVGGLIGLASLAMWGESTMKKGRLLLVIYMLFGVSIIFLAYSHSFVIIIVALVVVNALGAATGALSQTLIQLTVPNDQRGLAMGAWVAGVGFAPAGQLELGALTGFLGPPLALLINGAALVGLSLVAILSSPRLRRL